MGTLLNAMIYVGPVTFVAGSLVAIACLVLQLLRPDKRQVLRMGFMVAGLGVVGFLAGTTIGMLFFCATASAGNLCGLGGIFGTGPLAAGIGMGASAVRQYRAHDVAP